MSFENVAAGSEKRPRVDSPNDDDVLTKYTRTLDAEALEQGEMSSKIQRIVQGGTAVSFETFARFFKKYVEDESFIMKTHFYQGRETELRTCEDDLLDRTQTNALDKYWVVSDADVIVTVPGYTVGGADPYTHGVHTHLPLGECPMRMLDLIRFFSEFACYTQRSVGFHEQYFMGFEYALSGTADPPITLDKHVYAGVNNWWEALDYDDIAQKPPHVVYMEYYR